MCSVTHGSEGVAMEAEDKANIKLLSQSFARQKESVNTEGHTGTYCSQLCSNGSPVPMAGPKRNGAYSVSCAACALTWLFPVRLIPLPGD
jgi:hypothetical protein